MKTKITVLLAILTTLLLLIVYIPVDHVIDNGESSDPNYEQESDKSKIETKIARNEYFFRLLRNPATNRIPANIRARELNYARSLPTRDQVPLRFNSTSTSSSTSFQATAIANEQFNWSSVGPEDVGGRTRALNIDPRDPDVIIAGGVSGGIWKSTDRGMTWSLKTDPTQNPSVTYVTRHPNNPDTLYYASGEFSGNSATDRGAEAFFFGTGIYQSTDNGETWNRLSVTADDNSGFDSEFDFISRVVVNPSTGSIFFSSNGFGVYRSTDDGASFSLVLGTEREQQFSTIAVASDGTLVGVISEATFGSGAHNPGIFVSTNDGTNWTEVTPTSFPSSYGRSVVAFAPSNPDIFYVFTEKNGDSSNQGASFYKFDISNGISSSAASSDRAGNIPDFGEPVGHLGQMPYNMILAVKPNDPDFVLLGTINLLRSSDGFSTAPADTDSDGITDDTEKDKFWIGGYAKANNVSQYTAHHPDQHILAFDPNNANQLWSGHDGGLSLTSDITATSVSWTDMNNGYITTQFYTVALPSGSSDDRIMGGTQDNGTPFFRVDNNQTQITNAGDISSGDGAWAFFTPNFIFVSSQNGRVLRHSLDQNGNPSGSIRVDPSGASGQLFINPFFIDPNLESTMYYPADSLMWRNKVMDQSSTEISNNWESFTAVSNSTGYSISTLEVTDNPSNILYYAASHETEPPRIFKLTNANSSTSPTEIPISTAPSGAYLHDIAVNPNDGDELLALMSNYDIIGLYHSSNGGQNWTAVEGNLTGTASNPGPSLRSAAIIPAPTGTIYLLGTSTGVYSTTSLNGSSTQWVQESPNGIGFSVSEFVVARTSDNTVAVGSHGRGIFKGTIALQPVAGAPAAPTNLSLTTIDSDNELSWTGSTSGDVVEYHIYRAMDSDTSDFALYDSVDASTTSFTDQNVVNQPLFYRIKSVDITDTTSTFSNMASAFRGTRAINMDWKMVSTPGDSNLSTVPPSGSQLVRFNGAYQVASQMVAPAGYWVKASSADNITYNARSLTSATVKLNEGWNLIGSLTDTITTAEISDPGGILSNADVHEYVGGTYQTTSILIPTLGYWIHANQAGSITMALPSAQAPAAPTRSPLAAEKPEEQFDRIVFSSNGVSQTFYVAGYSLTPVQKERYLMPPQAPEPAIDVRTQKGYKIADVEETRLNLSAGQYPVTVTLKLQDGSTGRYRLLGIGENEEVIYDLKPEKPLVIESAHPKMVLKQIEGNIAALENNLFPNYPNPFNPSTTIRYELDSRVQVNLEVYDILGRKIQTLVNEVQQPGRYTVNFNGSRLSSGMYFIRINAGDFTRIQKMTLIK